MGVGACRISFMYSQVLYGDSFAFCTARSIYTRVIRGSQGENLDNTDDALLTMPCQILPRFFGRQTKLIFSSIQFSFKQLQEFFHIVSSLQLKNRTPGSNSVGRQRLFLYYVAENSASWQHSCSIHSFSSFLIHEAKEKPLVA